MRSRKRSAGTRRNSVSSRRRIPEHQCPVALKMPLPAAAELEPPDTPQRRRCRAKRTGIIEMSDGHRYRLMPDGTVIQLD